MKKIAMKVIALLAAAVMLVAMGITVAAEEIEYVVPTVNYNDENDPESITLSEIPAGGEVWFQEYGLGGLLLTIENASDLYVTMNETVYTADASGVITVALQSANPRMPVSFGVGNNGTENTEVLVGTLAYPVGSYENPDEFWWYEGGEASNTASIEAGSQGYYYSFVAPDAGTITVAVDVENTENGWSLVVNNVTAGLYGDYLNNVATPLVYSVTYDVAAGDEIQVMVNTYDYNEPWTAPAGEVIVNVTYDAVKGTMSDPYWVEYDYENEVNVLNVEDLAAGTEVWCAGYRLGGMILNIESETAYVIHNGEKYEPVEGVISVVLEATSMWDPVYFLVGNSAEEADTVSGTVVYAEGTWQNPIKVDRPADMPTSITLESFAEIYYSLGQALNGMELTVKGEEGFAVGVGYDTIFDEDDGVVDGVVTVVLDYTDTTLVFGMSNWTTEEATYTVSLAWPVGHVNNPIAITNPSSLAEVEVSAEGDMSYTLGSNFDGAILTVEGTGVVIVNGTATEVDGSADVVVDTVDGVALVTFVNEAEEDATYKVTVSYPAGHVNNPISVINPSSIAEVKVPANGDMNYTLANNFDGAILTVTGTGIVIVNGETIEVDGSAEIAVSTDNGVASLAFVNEADEDATFEVAVSYPAGHANNPIELNNPSSLPTTLEVATGEDITFKLGSNFDGAVLTVKGENVTVVVNGEIIVVDGTEDIVLETVDGVVEVAIVNTGAEDAEYELSVGYPAGHVNNPLHLERPASMDEKVALEAGEEFWYSYGMAFEAAVLTVEGENAVVIVNGTVYEAKDGAVEVVLPEDVQSIVVGFVNESAEAVEYSVSLELPDVETGDTTTIMPVIVMVLAAVAFVAVVDKKRKMA